MFQPTPSSQHKASPVEMLQLKSLPPPGASPTHDDNENELKQLLQEAATLESRGHVMQSLHVRERALLVQYTQTLTEIDTLGQGNVTDATVRPYVEATIKRARTLVLQLNGASVRLFKADDFDSAGQLLAAAIRICDSSDTYSYFFDNWEMRMELKATTYNNLGCMERRRGRLAVALQYLRQALELPATPSAALHLNVSGVLAQLGRNTEALYAAQKAIAVADETHGTETVPFPGLRAVARHNLATILEKTDLAQAVTVAAEAVQLAEAELGTASPTTVPIRQTFNRLQANLLRKEQEDLLKAEAEREQAEKQREWVLAEEQRKAALKAKKRGAVRNQYGTPGKTNSSKLMNQDGSDVNNNSKNISGAGGSVIADQIQNQHQKDGGHQSQQQYELIQGQQPGNSTTTAMGLEQQSIMSNDPNSFAQSMSMMNNTDGRNNLVGTSGLRKYQANAPPPGSSAFVGAVRKVNDTRPGFSASSIQEQQEAEEEAKRTGNNSSPTTSAAYGGAGESRPGSAVSFMMAQTGEDPNGQTGTGNNNSTNGKPGVAKRSLTDRLMKQAGVAGLGVSVPKPHIVRTVASEEAALGDVVNFLSHRLVNLLKNEEMDTKRFGAARCIQCAMRVALAKNELARRKVRRYQGIQRNLDRQQDAAHLIISFFLRLRERRRRHREDRRIAAERQLYHHRCAIKIQSLVRLWRAKRILLRLKKERTVQNGAAVIIQRQMRRVLAFSAVQRLRGARAMARYQRVGLERLFYAAQVIQRAYRMHRARNQKLIKQGHFKQALARDWRALRSHSAILIQKVARGYITRRHTGPILRERNKLRRNRETTKQRISGTKLLQAVGRAFMERKFLLGPAYPVFVKWRNGETEKKKNESAAIVQRCFRSHMARKELRHLRQEKYRKDTDEKHGGVLMLSSKQLHRFGTESLNSTLNGTTNSETN